MIRRAYDEPIPFIPVVDKTNVQKPRDIKIPLRQNPAVANSNKVEKTFQEFVENSPEAYCRWRCDTEEYIKGAGITTPAAKLQAGQQLLGPQHKTTWDTVISTVAPGDAVTTEEQVQEIHQAFALNFMEPVARRRQKRYMASGTIAKPRGWSTRQAANRLTTLNRYLQYLPGHAANFSEEELKDMLVDLHSPAYQHLLARASYDTDKHSFLELTNYLQSLSLIEETLNRSKTHAPGEAKAHKKNKNLKHKSKLGKAQCRKHPNHEHTWADCWQNPKNANKKKPFVKDDKKPRAEARNTTAETDSDADMDRAIMDLTKHDEVRTGAQEHENVRATKTSTNSARPLNGSTVIRISVEEKEGGTLMSIKTKRTSKNISNKKRRLLNKSFVTHDCCMQLPLGWKLRRIEKEDPTTITKLTTEISALVKSVNGAQPRKLPRVLIDTGCSKTLIKKGHVPSGLALMDRPLNWSTNGGTFATRYEVPLTIVFPEFSSSMEVQWNCAVDENPDSTYDMIIGRDLQLALKMDISFSTGTVTWNEVTIPMRTGQPKAREELNDFLEEAIARGSEPEILREELYETRKILDADYKKADIEEVVRNIPHLTQAEKNQVRTMLYNFESLFEGKLGLWDTPPITLELEEGAKPFHARAYPIPHIHEATTRKEVERLCREGVLERDSDSQWAAPTFIIPKKEGTVRFVTDFRQLNKALKRKPYPIPNIQDILQKLGGFTYATALDLNMGYYNIRLDPYAASLCTLVLPWGKYKYKRLPMGIKNSPDIFQEKINNLMEGLEDFIRAYLDDILIITKGSYEDHLAKVSEVLKRLQSAGLQVNLPKSKIAVTELEYLGYWLTPKGIRPMAKKVEAIKNLQAPKTVKQVRSFLGMVNYYKDMWQHRSHLLAPLTDLTANKDGSTGKKRGPIKWEQIHQEAFDKIKQAITDEVMLSFPDFNKPFEIHTDASDYQLGSVIMQDRRPIAFYSRKLNSAQRNYTTGEREMLSIVETLRAYRNILLGHEIVIYTDHMNLVNDRTRHESARIQRWIWLIEEFGPKFQYLPGAENPVADALSRLDNEQSSPAEEYNNPATCFATLDCDFLNPFLDDDEEHLAENVFSGTHKEQEIIFPLSAQIIKEAQRKDKDLLKRLRDKPGYSDTVLEGTDLITYKDKIYIPHALRSSIVEWYHSMLGHPGVKRTAATIIQHLIWPGLHDEVEKYVSKCPACQLYKGQKKKYGHLPIKDVEVQPWKTVCVDLIGPYTVRTKKGVQSLHAMTMFDPATSWFEVVEIPNKKAITCANLLENTWLCRYPRPQQCIFDNGSEFLGAEFANTLDSYGIQRVPTTIKNPAANMVERVHQTLGNLLRVYELEEYEFPRGDPWSNILASAAWAIRSTLHTTLGATPGQLVYGRDMLYDLAFKANWQDIKERKRARIEDSNKRENAKRIRHQYRIGDLVTKDRNQLQPKLHRPRDGPYRIEKVYTNGVVKIRNGVISEKVSIRRINPYNT